MKRMGKKRRTSLRAAAAVEMALVSPFLITMMFGIVHFGLLFLGQQSLVHAAREGARLGVIQGVDVEEVETRVMDLLETVGLDDVATLEVTEATDEDPTVTVRISVPREEVSPIGHFFGQSTGTLTALCSMRKEGV